MQTEKLDTLTTVETPEAIDVVLRPAGIMPRSIAFLIDFLIRWVWFLGSATFLVFLGSLGIGLIILNLFFTLWLYFVICEVKFNGRSIGKKAMGLRVVNDDGTPIQFLASLLRNLLRIADAMPMLYTFGIASSLVSPQSKRLGDLVAGTIVVYADKKMARPKLANVTPIPSPVVLTQEEQKAILAFAERSEALSFDRQQELAMIIAPALHVPHSEAVPLLWGIAQDIAGEFKMVERA